MNKTPHFLLTEEEVVTPAVNSIILQTNNCSHLTVSLLTQNTPSTTLSQHQKKKVLHSAKTKDVYTSL